MMILFWVTQLENCKRRCWETWLGSSYFILQGLSGRWCSTPSHRKSSQLCTWESNLWSQHSAALFVWFCPKIWSPSQKSFLSDTVDVSEAPTPPKVRTQPSSLSSKNRTEVSSPTDSQRLEPSSPAGCSVLSFLISSKKRRLQHVSAAAATRTSKHAAPAAR